jgi:hypothetical protein
LLGCLKESDGAGFIANPDAGFEGEVILTDDRDEGHVLLVRLGGEKKSTLVGAVEDKDLIFSRNARDSCHGEPFG